MKKLYLIHGWDGSPENAWFPLLKKEAETKGFEVIIPTMPNPDEPRIKSWVSKINEIVKELNENTYFISHSIGGQAVMRYLQTLPKDTKIGGVILVSPWIKLDEKTLEEEGEEVLEIAKPWMETSINWKKIKEFTDKYVCIFSDNDPYISLKDTSNIFKEKLKAKIIIESGKGHFDDASGIKKLPVVLKELEKIILSS